MRFLAVTETCDLSALYLRLVEAGHEVRVSISEPLARGTLAGMVRRVDDWRAELGWIRDGGTDGIILFEAVSEGLGALQDQLRREGYHVVGGSAYGDRLENDRAFAQGLLGELGFRIAPTRGFVGRAGLDYLEERMGRYVLKFCGDQHGSHESFIGQRADGADVRALLAARLAEPGGDALDYVLMDHLEGIEMGVGAYFDGNRFLEPACLDWEHKRFFAGDMGELTGEMGTVATFAGSGAVFEASLHKLAPLLRAHRHVGYVNLNMMVNGDGLWPLEFTCRFGYPGFAVLEPLQQTDWATLLAMMANGGAAGFETSRDFSVGLVMTTPPFPYSRKEVVAPVGLPVFLPEEMSAAERAHYHLAEVGLAHDQLVTSGLYGWTMVVTGTGATIAGAQEAAYRRAARLDIPNLRYRLDIGDRLAARDYARLAAWGLVDVI